MPTADGGPGVEVDVEALYRAATLLRDAAPGLAGTIDDAARAYGAAVPAAGAGELSSALAVFAHRWDEAAGAVGRRVDESATVLRATVDAFVAADEAGVRGLAGPR